MNFWVLQTKKIKKAISKAAVAAPVRNPKLSCSQCYQPTSRSILSSKIRHPWSPKSRSLRSKAIIFCANNYRALWKKHKWVMWIQLTYSQWSLLIRKLIFRISSASLPKPDLFCSSITTMRCATIHLLSVFKHSRSMRLYILLTVWNLGYRLKF